MQVIILGASKTGIMLLERLVDGGHEVVLVDHNAEELLAKLHLESYAVNGVIIDADVLLEAGIASCDAVCAISDSQNQNLMSAQIAHDIYKVPNVVTRIFEDQGLAFLETVGFTVISSPELTVDAFMYSLEDKNLAVDTKNNIHRILGENIEFSVIYADEDIFGCKIKDVEDTDKRHVFGIIRKEEMILSMPDLKIEKGDKLILASL